MPDRFSAQRQLFPIGREGALLVALLAALAPCSAQAHLVSTGLGPFYDGIGHFVLGIESWLPLLALALLAGLHGSAQARRVLTGLPLGWLLAAGVTAGFLSTPAAAGRFMNIAPALLMVILGVLAAASVRLSLGAITVLATATGLMLGWLDGTGLAGRSDAALLLAGNLAALLVTLCLFLGLATALARSADWRRIAVRALASWVAAAGLLLLGWQLR